MLIEPEPRSFLTAADAFRDVSRGNPKPYTLKGDELVKARLTPESWRLEIVSDGSTQIDTPRTLDKNTAIDLPTLEKLGKEHGRKFLKAMQCLNIAQPLGQGLWEGVPLREVLKLAGIGTPDGQILTGEGWSIRVRLDEDALKVIADMTRAEYFFAGNALDLKKIYEGLNSKLVMEKKETEVTALFTAAAGLLALVAAGLSLLWFNRLL